jgi:hypothetical protein
MTHSRCVPISLQVRTSKEKNAPGDLLIRPARGVCDLLVGGTIIGDALFSLECVEACTRALSAYVIY